ncbi:MAG: ImmA/IrrE family metallo-endopeptidase [Bacteroidales bacterium]|nr:ImmA/IrrE family metallo-endopeptidase [Bacteroidales bacterium]
MKTDRIHIPKDRYQWAIERAGLSLDEFEKAHPKLYVFVAGEKDPTVKQLEGFANTVHVPVGFLMMEKPPVEKSPIPMFRGEALSGKFDLNIYQTILDIQRRQAWLADYLEENELERCSFAGKYSSSLTVSEMAGEVRRLLNLSEDWTLRAKSPEEAIATLRNLFEEQQICVFFNSVVGNNTSRKLNVEACRGFALVSDPRAPMIFVNNADSKRAQLFTLIHEFVHVMLGFSAGFGGYGHVDNGFGDHVETYCDSVAAEVLVPTDLLRLQWKSIEVGAQQFKVSRVVIARRAYAIGLISLNEYQDFFLGYRRNGAKAKGQEGGAFYATSRYRVGVLFAAYVNRAVMTRQLSPTEAYRLTGLYGDTYKNFMSKAIG